MSTVCAISYQGALSTRRLLRSFFLFIASIIFALDVSAFRTWDERRGVVDDLCYLRQAHLFQRFGLAGIGTDISKDDDGYFRALQREARFERHDEPLCHVAIAKTKSIVVQYPPGTGFVMSFFPEGSQVAWLFSLSTLVVMSGVIFIVAIASVRASIIAAGLFGLCALYFMVNPTKASYSMAPTTAVCIVAAILSPLVFQLRSSKGKIVVAGLIGLLLGLSVTFRTANLLLVTGYVVVFGLEYLRRRDWPSFSIGALFSAAYLVGLAPALIANYVNAGGPFATTYGAQDTQRPDLTFSIVGQYLMDLQGALAAVAIAGTAWMFYSGQRFAPVAIVAINLAVNLGFFFTHPIYTQYYIMPVVTLALWALLAQWLLENRRSVA